MKKLVLITIMIATANGAIFGQDTKEEKNYQFTKLPSIGAGIGVLSFSGDVGSDKNLSALSNFRNGAHFFIEQRIFNHFGAGVNLMMGRLSRNERSASLNRNFQTSITAIDFKGYFHFDRGLEINKKVTHTEYDGFLSPFISAGIGTISFDPMGDLLNENNQQYYYWSDGSIKNLPENDPNAASAVDLHRDYTYETILDTNDTQSNSALSIPLTFGFKYNMSRKFDINISATYYLAQTDFIDYYEEGGNDKFFYLGASLNYNIGAKSHAQQLHTIELWNPEADLEDSDGDSISDLDDHCPGTPKGTEVDDKGCPLDDDKDGIPNYLDQEPNSLKGFTYDEEGFALTPQRIKEKAIEDSLLAARGEHADHELPVLCVNEFGEIVDCETNEKIRDAVRTEPSKLPLAFQIADRDKDDYISLDEIYKAIDSVFTGEEGYTVNLVSQLIDFFFDQ